MPDCHVKLRTEVDSVGKPATNPLVKIESMVFRLLIDPARPPSKSGCQGIFQGLKTIDLVLTSGLVEAFSGWNSGETSPCKVTPVILHGVVFPESKVTPVILHGVVSPEKCLVARRVVRWRGAFI
jgi:hypothetical protein